MALWILSSNEVDKDSIGEEGGIPPLVALVEDGDDEQKENASGALWNLSLNDGNKERIDGVRVIPTLVSLMLNGTDIQKENAVGILCSISACDENKENIATSECIPELVALLRSSNKRQQKNAAETLQNVMAFTTNWHGIFEAGIIPLLVTLVEQGTEFQTAQAASILWAVVIGKNRDLGIRDGSLVEALTKVIYTGTPIHQERASQVMAFMGQHLDPSVKDRVAINGGAEAVLSYIRRCESNTQIYEGLTAFRDLCLNSGVTVRSVVELAGGTTTLVALSKSGDDMISELATRILVWLNGTFDELAQLCDRMGEAEPLFRHMLNRLKEISGQGVSSTARLRVRFNAILSMIDGKSMVLRLVGANSVAEALARLHKKIDFLEKKHPRNAWKCQWEIDKRAMMKQLFDCDMASLVSDLVSKSAQMEALTLLVHELKDAHSSYSEQEKEFLNAVIRHIVGFSNIGVPSEKSWFIARHDIVMEDASFNRGSFGQIYRGTYMNAPVVVKCVDILSEAYFTNFMREVSVWREATRHPNIVEFYGVCHVGQPCFMVCKDIAGGSLLDYLKRQKETGQSKVWRALLDVTHGLQFLHSRNIVHGDLKGNNILVDGDTAMLTDFGMSFFETESQPHFDNLGAIRWRAPEYVASGKTSFEGDVYSLGMVIVEVVGKILPWGMAPDMAVKRHMENGHFMNKPELISDEQWKLVCAMCDFDPSKRMKLDEVEKKIKTLAETEEDTSRLAYAQRRAEQRYR